ncbi:MAG: SRPBCC domain-containing protein [Rhodothermia bacterium]|nr:MAG: SRPBCC domain-containing protein [Rhodothermia bacterium]
MSVETTSSLKLSRIINGSREEVFDAWTNPDKICQWSAPEGISIEQSDVDLREGGEYLLLMNSPENKTHTAFGTYREVKRPSRLVYTWDWKEEDNRMGDTLVTVEFNEMGETTEVVITHELFPNDEARDGHDMGWASCLNRLEGLFA